MGNWQKELDKVLKLSEADVKAFEKATSHYEKAVDAAQSFISGYAKFAPKLGKVQSTLMESAETCGVAAAELSVYEDEYEQAKRDKDKAKMKELDRKMKPLIATFEAGKKENRAAAEEGNKGHQDVVKLGEAVCAALS